jgi:DNA mismatch repair protein MutS
MNQRDPNGADAAATEKASGRITPMMEQYIEIRAANPDCLLFYRMGDFYELFFDDAVTASRALGITLTKRGRHLGQEIPMCGVPVHAADDYLRRLIAQGFRIAVCEQTEDPAEARRRGGKSVVRRNVTRLVTPGTITEDGLLDSGRSNHLAALAKNAGGERCAFAWADISTGEFRMAECAAGELAGLMAQVEPRELLIPEKSAGDAEMRAAGVAVGAMLTPLPAAFFDGGSAELRLAALFGVRTMEAFGNFSRGELVAGAALVAYIEKTQVSKRPPLEPPRRVSAGETMRLDAATRANLELFRGVSGGRQGSLFAALDRTSTAAGARLLAERLASPLSDPGKIDERLDSVQFFLDRPALRKAVRETLSSASDMMRALSRLGLDRGGPRDLDGIRAGIAAAQEIAQKLNDGENRNSQSSARGCYVRVARICLDCAALLQAALADDLPLLKRDGGFARQGYDSALDEAKNLRDESRRVIASLQARYAEASGIRALKIRHNNFLGYYVEVTAGQAQALTANGGGEKFVHRQTMANAMRFSTAELADLEQKIASAADRALQRELEIFSDLAGKVAAAEREIREVARSLAEIDVASALADLAAAENYVRPRVDRSLAFHIEGGRHPVVEQALRGEGQSFVGNDCDLGSPLPLREMVALGLGRGPGEGAGDRIEESAPSAPPHPPGGQARPAPSPARGEGEESAGAGRIWLLTGPNMAGKSTFLRQNALIAVMAQAGSFVPARLAHIGIVDAVFSRVGAADDLARGRSTFMVEMVETAAILNQAGPRALVILDEIGRGTATFDGLSIAWATLEHLHETNCCRTLFATHYHELTALAAKLDRLMNATMKVKEWKGDVVFLHEVAPGAADRSYGIQVAKLAGLPAGVISRARQVLDYLETSERSRPKAMTVDDLPLFSVKPKEEEKEHPALVALEALNPDELTPKEALERLYELKRLGRGES